MAILLLVQVDHSVAERIEARISESSRRLAAKRSTPGEALETVEADPSAVAAMVVGAAVPEPLRLTQRVHWSDRSLSVVILREPGAQDELEKALLFTPFLGEDIRSLGVESTESAVEQVLQAAERRERRQAFSKTAAAMNEGLSEPIGPSQIAGHFGRLLDEAPIGVVTVDTAGKVYGMNRHARDLLDVTETEMLGHPFFLLFASPEREQMHAYLAEAMSRSDPLPARTFDRSSVKGSPQFLELSALAMDVAPGQAGAIVLLQDETAREQMRRRRYQIEEALWEQRRWFETTLMSIGDAVIAADEQGKVALMNRAAEEMTGWSFRDATGVDATRIIRLLGEGTRQEMPHPVTRILHGGADREVRLTERTLLITKDGQELLVEESGAPICDSTGHVVGAVLVFRDISERRQAERALEARARKQAAVAQVGQKALAGMAVGTLLNEVVEAVARTMDVEFSRLLRLTPDRQRLQVEAGIGWESGVELNDEAAGRGSQPGYALAAGHSVVVDDVHDERRFPQSPFLADHQVVSGVSVIVSGPDERPWGVLEAHTRSRRAFSDDDLNFLQAMANIVAAAIQRHTTEQQLRSLNETLEQRVSERTAEAEHRARQLQAMAGELTQAEQRERRRLADLLHDSLQQVLAAGKMQISMVMDQVDEGRLRESLRQVKELITESISMSRNLTLELSPPVLHHGSLVDAFQWLCEWTQEKHGLSVELDVQSTVELDDERLRVLVFQSVRELLFNVVKYSGVKEARLVVGRVDDMLEVKVVDRGQGFDPDQEFEQARKRGGFGLFSIGERVELMGGQMKVDSRPGEGTTVTLRVPLEPAGEATDSG